MVLGFLSYSILKSVDNYQVEILVTLALVTGGYALALSMHTSGPIAIVVAGLLIGNHGRKFAMSERTRERLDMFWQLLDEMLNSVLFVLIGLELFAVKLTGGNILPGIISIPIALFSRFASIGMPVCLLRLRKKFSPGALRIMTWGGLRGGISVALALSLPAGHERDLILTMTYTVVVFSILVQGLTIKYLIKSGV
jgi:CPA1 family monovalent cation:H+ antiporter